LLRGMKYVCNYCGEEISQGALETAQYCVRAGTAQN
jgi:RNA polymerase-binding transcription factor DksA